MRAVVFSICVAGLAACSPPIPDSGPSAGSGGGVGFSNYDRYIAEKRARDAQLARQQAIRSQPQVVTVEPSTAPVTAVRTPEQQTAAEAVAVIREQSAAPQVVEVETRTAPVQTAAASSAVPLGQNNPGISDEQDFNAVSSRETIESDAQRRQRQSAQYEVVAPTAVPNRPANVTPTPIEFALSTSHNVGQRQHNRGIVNRSKAAQACQAYTSTDLAQDAFLKAGGPSRDRLGLDPDGDGFACGWNPAKYRGLRGG